MRGRATLIVALTVIAAVLVAAPVASATPIKTQAQIVGPVQIDDSDPGRASVTLRYICQTGTEVWFWVSAKQAASARPDPALQQEGSSQVAAAWLQSHPLAEVTCDGRWRTDTFEINTDPDPYLNGWGGHGELTKGQVWVQICLYDGENIVWPARWTMAL